MDSNPSIFDRRTLLAFVLMFAVWFIWVTVFPQGPADEPPVEEPVAELDSGPVARTIAEPEPEDSPPVVSDSTGATAPDSAGVVMPVAGGWAAVEPSGRGEPIRISTPHYEALLDPVGADLLQWKLRDYDEVGGTAVDLVFDQTTDIVPQYAHALRVQLEDRALELRRVVFESDRRELVLDEGDAPGQLLLTARRGDGSLRLQFTFDPERYGFDVEASFRPDSGDGIPMSFGVGWPGGIAPSEPDSTMEYREYRAVARVGEDVHKVKYGDLVKGSDKAFRTFEGTVSWGGVQSKYFLAAVIDPDPRRGYVRVGGDSGMGLQTFETSLAMEGEGPATARYSVYLGPSDFDELAVYDEDPWNAKLSSLIDLGWGPIRPVAEVTLFLLRQFHRLIPNWGWTIIIFSVLTKLLFWPLTKSSTESMKRMQEIQPQLQGLKEKYKDDQQKQTQEMMRIYKENKVNPVGGCLPLLVQMPVFFALFTILRKSIDLRQADFGFWIHDLSRPDVLFHLPFSLPFLGDNFSLLPLLMAIAMFAQTKISQSTSSPSAGGENMMAQQMKMMNTMMPLMMFFIFYRSPSGLVLYWLVNTILTAAQTWHVHNRSAAPKANAAT